jgi:hypothetical protein
VKIFLASTGVPEDQSCIGAQRRLAGIDRFGVHAISDDPEAADIILFLECHLIHDWRLRAILESPLVRRFREKCYVYDERDRPWCALPGIFVSMPRRHFRPEYQRAWGYYLIEEPFTRLGLAQAPAGEPDLLASLVATRTHRSRNALFGLAHERAVIEEVSGFVFFDPSSRGYREQRARFAELLYRSKFVLCPRGMGTSSIRLYETMAAGRVPVIIADDWVPPAGPEWGTFAIRWPENRAEDLIAHLEAIEHEAEPRGARARRAFLEFFAPDTAFHWIAETLGQIHENRPAEPFPEAGLRGRSYWETRLDIATAPTRARLGSVKRSFVR